MMACIVTRGAETILRLKEAVLSKGGGEQERGQLNDSRLPSYLVHSMARISEYTAG